MASKPINFKVEALDPFNSRANQELLEERLANYVRDERAFKKINSLIKSIDRKKYNCIRRPEKLTGNLSAWWSVKFTQKDRIVFRITQI